MRITTKEGDRVVERDVARWSRVPVEPGSKGTIDSVEVEETAEGDVVKVRSRGKLAGVLVLERGVGERIARWLLPHARTEVS